MIVSKSKRRLPMPVLSQFYGIIIRMYFLQSEHNPPHIHAIYNEDVALIDFFGNVLEGYLPNKALNMVKEWVLINKNNLPELNKFLQNFDNNEELRELGKMIVDTFVKNSRR